MDGNPSRVIDQTLDDFTAALASKAATPGGGAAAAVGAALGASLTAMVVRLSMGKADLAEHAELHTTALEASDAARTRFLDMASDDADAYAAYQAARRSPRDTADQEAARDAAITEAVRAATAVPLRVVEACQAQVELVERLAGRTNRNVASDLEVAAYLLEGAARSAASNVRANLVAMVDPGYVGAVRAELDQRLQRIQSAADQTRERTAKGAPRSPETE